MIKHILLLAVFIAASISLYAVNNVPVLVEGKITEEISGKPIGISFKFVNSQGKKIPVKSNKNDGEYSTTVMSGDDYTFVFDGYEAVTYNPLLTIDQTDKYKEIKHDFVLRAITPGKELFLMNPFKTGDSIPRNELEKFTRLKDYLIEQSKLNVVITISANDTKFKNKKIKVKIEGSNKTKTETITAQKQAALLVESRINSLKKYLNENGIRTAGIKYIIDEYNYGKGYAKTLESKKSKSKTKYIDTMLITAGTLSSSKLTKD